MTIEVRQLLIRSQVGAAASPEPAAPVISAFELNRLKEQLLSECKAWLREELAAARER